MQEDGAAESSLPSALVCARRGPQALRLLSLDKVLRLLPMGVLRAVLQAPLLWQVWRQEEFQALEVRSMLRGTRRWLHSLLLRCIGVKMLHSEVLELLPVLW